MHMVKNELRLGNFQHQKRSTHWNLSMLHFDWIYVDWDSIQIELSSMESSAKSLRDYLLSLELSYHYIYLLAAY